MKKTLQLVFLFTLFTASAQDINLRWAEKIKTKGQVSILGGKNGLYYTTHVNNDNELVGRTYDSNMNFTNEKVINFNLDDKKYSYQGAYFLNNQILHFIKDYKRKEDISYLYSGISDSKLVTSSTLNILDEEIDDNNPRRFGERSISPDSTKIVIYHENRGKKKDPDILVYKVYNSSLTEVVNEGAASLPIKSKNFITENIEVDNIGNVYILAKVYKEKKEVAKDNSKYYYKLIVFAKDKSIKEFDFEYPDNDISYIDILPGKNDTFFCAGFLTNLKGRKEKMISDEMFFASLDCKTLTLSDSKMLKVPGLYPDEIKKVQDYVPYKIRNIFERKDGGYTVVAEQYKLIVSTHTSANGMTTTSYRYFYCDIACIQTDEALEVTSVTRMPKYQLNASNPSIISTVKNDKTYIIYEDLTKNIEATDDKKTKRSTKSIFSSDSKNALFLLTIEKNGEMRKEIIYDYKESKIQPFILGSRVIEDGLILLNANDQLGILEIK